jgi:capsular exopolysaccharide synthesis family protein
MSEPIRPSLSQGHVHYAAQPAASFDLLRAAQGASPALAKTWRAIAYRKWWILVAAAAITAIALFLSTVVVPQYKATATVLFDQGGRSRVVSIEDVYGGVGANRDGLHGQLEFLRSRDVAMRVIRKLALTTHPDLDPARPGLLAPVGDWLRTVGALPIRSELDPEQVEGIVLERFQRRLQVEPVRLSQLVKISFQSSDRLLAATVANELATAYIQADLDARFAVTERANEWLNSRLAYLKSKLDAAEAALQNYREKQGLVDARSSAQGGTGRQLDELNQRLVEARVRRAMAEQAYNQAQPGTPNLAQVPAIINHPAVQRARTAEIEAERRFNEIAARFGPAYPAYRSAEQELRVAKATTEEEVQAVAASIRKEYLAARAAEGSIEQTLSRARGSVQEINRKEIQQGALEREVDVNKQLYQLFLSRQRETSATSNYQVSPARVIDPAVPPLSPFSPNVPMVGGTALLLSLLLAAGVAVAWDRMDNTIKRADDFEELIGAPLITTVPKLPTGEVSVAHKMMLVSPNSHFAESIRSIASAVQLASLDFPKKVILVTSAVPGEGKSTVASNLALMQARLCKTLIVEADLRRPFTATRLGLSDRLPGLVEFVSGAQPLTECVHQLPDSRLWVMPCGKDVPNAAELFSTIAFRNALQSLAAMFDWVVIDAAPVRPVSDARLLSPQVTAVVFVASADSTPAPLVRMALRRLADSGARVLGVVLNRYDTTRAEKYYGDYSSYSGYAEDLKSTKSTATA